MPETQGVRMDFKPREMIVHPAHGVGRVVRVVARQFDDRSVQDYYEISISGGTVWVAVGDPDHGLRRVTQQTGLAQYRNLLKSRPEPLASDNRQRKSDLAERMKEATFKARCEILRDLWGQRSIKPLDESCNNLLKRVHELLCGEWAAADGSSIEEAAREVDALLVEGQGVYGNSGA